MVKSLFEIQPWVCFLPPVETGDSELAHKLPLNTEMKPILFSLNYQNRNEKKSLNGNWLGELMFSAGGTDWLLYVALFSGRGIWT